MSAANVTGDTFPSKRDAWIVMLIWVGALGAAFAGFSQLSAAASAGFRLLMFVLMVGVAGFMLWILYGTEYTFTTEELVIRCGPLRYRVPLAAIQSVTPSRNPLSSPACSLDRLLVQWQEGRRRILISPEPKLDFLRVLDQRCPQLKMQGDRLVAVDD